MEAALADESHIKSSMEPLSVNRSITATGIRISPLIDELIEGKMIEEEENNLGTVHSDETPGCSELTEGSESLKLVKEEMDLGLVNSGDSVDENASALIRCKTVVDFEKLVSESIKIESFDLPLSNSVVEGIIVNDSERLVSESKVDVDSDETQGCGESAEGSEGLECAKEMDLGLVNKEGMVIVSSDENGSSLIKCKSVVDLDNSVSESLFSKPVVEGIKVNDSEELAPESKVESVEAKVMEVEKNLGFVNSKKTLISGELIEGSESLKIVKEEMDLGLVNSEGSVDENASALIKCKHDSESIKKEHFELPLSSSVVEGIKVNDSEKLVPESKVEVKVKPEPLDLEFESKGVVLNPKPLSEMSPHEYVNALIKSVKVNDSETLVPNKTELPKKKPDLVSQTRPKYQSSPFLNRERVEEDKRLSTAVIEDGDFPEDADWLLVGRTVITGLSTTKGSKLVDNEIVHFTFPSDNVKGKSGFMFASSRAAAASSAIVRFSTKRSGEIGRLPMEWAKCLIPLVKSSKVKVLGRCVAAPLTLHLMQEIMLYISFYIHHSIFTEIDKTTWKLDANQNIDSTIYPLLTLFKLLKTNPFQKAEFTPEELDSRKRLLNLEAELPVLPSLKKGSGSQLFSEQSKDELAISESSLNKLVGAVDVYNLKEMDPPDTLTCDLRPYQKQALFWMTELEKGVDVEKAAETLHPCWAAYRITDERASAIYVNIFSGEATTQFPTAMQMARGGILADAMGLGKTVMTIALILSKPGPGSCDDQNIDKNDVDETEFVKKRKQDMDIVPFKVKGGTLIICPMALLSQWRDELETHSKPGTISTFVHYGGDRTDDPKVIEKHDVVLTTYGVLSAAFKSEGENSIFHKVDWFRVVLDEAHTIKSSKTQGAQAAFKLTSFCRWCLTGTPLQNNLEDLYSLLCFLHVEPWCNWGWWSKLIQRPYENGDQRAMKLIKAILRPLMLRRTKETKDKEGRPILVLPPTDIQVIECEQSEAEHDFYDALFRRSKVQFDQFVAQGKVLHNYANILELLLRLRQCCNHPFLVMSRGDSQAYADLNKLARRFLESNVESATSAPKVPSRAYVEEVIDNIRGGENTECPICLESADDPVFTPCAHRMCRECLLSSWRTPLAGLCPICRQFVKKTELITCPSDNKFRIDVEKNWKESSKISKLLDCLENIRVAANGQKSIIFSQWTSFLDLLEIALKRKRIGYLRFDGRLAQKQREKVLKEFNETQEKTVLLMSLKAGGVGLNLTAASNVFLMDPWWNPAVEEQAIMRIHRIGQKRTVSVRRFIVKDTVEERMQQVQARKQRMIAGALTDEEVRSARLEELKMLFR